MEKILQLLIFSISILCISGYDPDYCYAKDKSPYEYFSTYTSYDLVKGPTVKEEGCSPIYVWGLIKHGVRKLSNEQIERNKQLNQLKKDVEQNNKEKRCALCSEDLQNIISWNNPLSEKQNEDLAKKAFTNHELFASYLGNFIDSPQPLTKNDFEILASKVEGAKDSALKFTNKLLGVNSQSAGDNGVIENNDMLKTKQECAKWPTDTQKLEDFESSPLLMAMMFGMTARLGYKDRISINDVKAMYESCVIGNSLPFVNTNKPPFCAAFTNEDLKVIEYFLDLIHYSHYGYGNTISEKMGCPLVKDMMDKLRKASTGSLNGKKGSLYFADDEQLMGFITKMGLYKDTEPINRDNYHLKKESREWKSSSLSPFTATSHAVLFNCANNEKKIEFYVNQRLVKFGACLSSTTNKCSLDTFISEVKKTMKEDKCDENFCGEFPKESGSNVMGYSFIVTIVCFLLSRL